MLGLLFTFIAPLFSFAVGSAFPNPQLANTAHVQKAYNSRCYSIEPKEKFIVNMEDLDAVHKSYPLEEMCYDPNPIVRDKIPNGLIDSYTRIRKNLKIVAMKVDNAKEEWTGGCTRDSNALRLVGFQNGKEIYWQDVNYLGESLEEFIFIRKEPDNKLGSGPFFAAPTPAPDYVFDVYAKDSILHELPKRLANCKETGGLVPVTEGESGILPPQLVPFDSLDSSRYKKNYQTQVSAAPDYFPPGKIYMVKIDKQNLPDGTTEDNLIGIYKSSGGTNSVHTYNVFYHTGSFYLQDHADQSSYVYGVSATGPPQSVPNKTSLQLGRLWFMMVASWTNFTPNCKPAIYLYPPKTQNIKVQLDILGKITVSDPIYKPDVGWNVKAYPNGNIQLQTTNNKQPTNFPYLFYEAELEKGYKPTEGWLIDRNQATEQLGIILTQLGLSQKERNDFLEYWIPRLVGKPYYFAGLASNDEVNKQEILNIIPSPTNVIRVRIIFEGLDYPVSVATPKLSEIKRNGFTVIDWGGSIVGETCEGKRIS